MQLPLRSSVFTGASTSPARARETSTDADVRRQQLIAATAARSRRLREFIRVSGRVVPTDPHDLRDHALTVTPLEMHQQLQAFGDRRDGPPDTASRPPTAARRTRTGSGPARPSSREWSRACPSGRCSGPAGGRTPRRRAPRRAGSDPGRCRRVARNKSRMLTAGTPVCSRRASKRTRFDASSCSSAVSSISTRRSSGGRKAASALSNVVLPVPVPPLIRMLSRASMPRRRMSSCARVSVPICTSSSAEKCRLWNLRMVSVVPPRLTGGSAAATREPSGRRESRSGRSSETSSPRTRARLRTATRRFCSRTVDVGDGLELTAALDKHPP